MVQTLLQLTVKDILQRPLFQKAETIASEEALNRIVRWVHIMEVPHVGHLLNGHELILNTGIGWHDNEELSLSFLQQLIDSGASGLCIELGTYTKLPLERLKELALREHFPLIFFHEEVRYIDITQDLHAYFIHQHYSMVSELEALSTQLNQLLLSGKGLQPLLQLLHETTHAQVAFFPYGEEARFIPELPRTDADLFYEQWIFGEIFRLPDIKCKLAHRPILALERMFADLLLYAEQELSEFQILALDRFATAIAQEMMRTTYMEEKKRYKQDLWVTEWLNGKHTQQIIRDYMLALKPNVKLEQAVVCVFESRTVREDVIDHEAQLLQKQMVARSIFEGEGFYLVPHFTNAQFVFILLDQLGASPFQDRMMRAIQRLQKTDHLQETALFSPFLGIGKRISDPSLLKLSYQTAQDTIDIQKDIGVLEQPFYDELHVGKVILMMKQSGSLASFIEEYLGPILHYDREKNGQLLKTLKMYLALSSSKQETAKELFIVRQTLYHRLDKIALLLGEDYMRPDKRMAIELALHGYEYIHGIIA
ncbi:PucR family transcriptional regulator ligand-binding domain-containing protein [Paenibacillus sp. CGMCC 1.16610]|uniref:PucR family transcriptional regulator n=1 Tax=Paenibacillus anseongense TaxID=2682845 RepID=A0ABW9ULX8_9BACL|nr:MULTISPECIES: PucR family transcriptional regulator [Paenibacillus]MBA2941191.1 PucR family transcriptional regulator ligand-binding domain-containing protein [Paenibacillus sp. CGMCC 1.16610]MVQ40011.1 PucR family transcriptional regulator [Paenibacillus anseongense]